MALTNYQAFKDSVPHAQVCLAKASMSTAAAGRMSSTWTTAPLAGVAPTTSAALDSTATGVLFRSPAGLAAWLRDFTVSRQSGGTIVIYDRLSHQGGLSAIVTTAQTTNLPTAALTRSTTGVGVMVALEVYTLIGTTVTTATVSYTNSAAVAARTSPLITIGATSDRGVGLFLPIPLQVGDVGVRSVESVTLAATTGSAGAFGVTLWRPLACINVPTFNQQTNGDAVRNLGAMFESFPADACLGMLLSAQTTTTGGVSGHINLIRQV